MNSIQIQYSNLLF